MTRSETNLLQSDSLLSVHTESSFSLGLTASGEVSYFHASIMVPLKKAALLCSGTSHLELTISVAIICLPATTFFRMVAKDRRLADFAAGRDPGSTSLPKGTCGARSMGDIWLGCYESALSLRAYFPGLDYLCLSWSF